MATTFQGVLEAALECPVCAELEGIPKQLTCGHTLCLGCIEKLLKVARQTEVNANHIKCPLCREDIKMPSSGPSGLKNNFTILQLRETLKTAGKSESTKFCEFCEISEKATRYCKDCQQYLCNSCAEEHLKRQAFSDDRVIAITSITCAEHNRSFAHMCIECDCLLCVMCLQRGKCDGHDVKKLCNIKDIKGKEADFLLEKINNLLDKAA